MTQNNNLKKKYIIENSTICKRKSKFMRFLANEKLFIVHLFLYLAVIGLLTVIWAVTIPVTGLTGYWPFFTIFGWGFAIGMHAITYLIYNDKVEYLTKVRKESTFGILFIYHAFLYISINAFLMIINLSVAPEILVFLWPLSMWGIAFGIHTLGFITYNTMLKKEVEFFKAKRSDYEPKKLAMKARAKLANSWFLIMHIAYFIVAIILVYVNIQNYSTQGITIIESSLLWAMILGVHCFGYILYYYNDSNQPITKSLFIHLAFFGVITGWGIYMTLAFSVLTVWAFEPIIMWVIVIIVHLIVVMKWETIISNSEAIIRRQYGDRLDKYDIHSRARWLAFWKWSFIAHICIYAAVLVITTIQISVFSLPIDILFHVAMGELIGLAIHGAIYAIMLKNIRGFWSWTFVLHLTTFIVVGVYIVLINFIYAPEFAWSVIALAGWGIGLGLHLIIAYMLRNKKIALIEVENTSVIEAKL